MAARKRESRTPWGWIAFGIGLAICVGIGGVVGVMLGQGNSESDTDARRVAALALDARGLNEDALGLSRAIEEAIAREGLEGEAESLRTELNRLDARAERIRVRAESEIDAARARQVSRPVQRGLGEISNTVAVFERDVVDSLEPVLDEPSSVTAPVGEATGLPDSSFEAALADVTRVLEEQGEAMSMLAENLEASGKEAEESAAEDAVAQGEDLLSGSFDGVLDLSGSPLEIEYELEGLEPEVAPSVADEPEADASGAPPGEATITSAAAGELTLKNTGAARASFELPTFHLVLYWKESGFPSALDGAFRTEPGLAEGAIEEGEASEGQEVESEEADDPCGYKIEGELHCALARLAFFGDGVDSERYGAGEVALRPDEEVVLDLPESDGSLAVEEEKADSAADFIESHPPDFVEVLARSVTPEFRPACVPPSELEEGTIEGAIVDPYPTTTLGLLTGDDEVVFEADAEGEPEAPDCYTLPGE